MVGFLGSKPDLANVCRYIVANWPTADTMQRAAIGELASNAGFSFKAGFGRLGGVPHLLKGTIWDERPSAVAIREKRICTVASRAQFQLEFPDVALALPDVAGLIAVPLLMNHTPLGVLVVASDHDLEHPGQAEEVISDFALVLSLYLRGGLPTSAHHRPELMPVAGKRNEGDGHGSTKRNHLTARQRAILNFLGERLTNRQIAERLGFSESTIRQETMAIYAYLQVGGRREAVHAAKMNGLIASPKPQD
jgi:DNA-binding NarL/FixJ family response regulator